MIWDCEEDETMKYVIKNDHGDGVYFKRMCTNVPGREGLNTPAFIETIDAAYVFDNAERALRMMGLISKLYPQMGLSLVPIEEEAEPTIRDYTGYVPLEKTVDAMVSDDYRKRLWAEYEQVNTRRARLKRRMQRYERKPYKTLEDDPEYRAMLAQINAMHDYMLAILNRCEAIGVDLDKVEKEIAKEQK